MPIQPPSPTEHELSDMMRDLILEDSPTLPLEPSLEFVPDELRPVDAPDHPVGV